MKDIGEEAVAVVPFDLGPWKFIMGWRYNPNSMCLSVLHFFFHFTTFRIELKNTDMVPKQYTIALKG